MKASITIVLDQKERAAGVTVLAAHLLAIALLDAGVRGRVRVSGRQLALFAAATLLKRASLLEVVS